MSDELERLYELLYLLPVGIVAFDTDGSIDAANPLVVQLLNPFVAPAATSNAFQLLAPLAPDLTELIANHDGGPIVFTHRRRQMPVGAGVAAMTIELSVHRARPSRFVAVLTDVSDLAQREYELRRERDRIQAIVDTVHEYAIYTLDASGRVDSWNASGERLFGLDAPDAVDRTLDELIRVDDLGELLGTARRAGWHSVETWSTAGPDGPFFTDSNVSALADISGNVDGFSVITRDATEMLEREEELRRQADTDPLTGAVNRRGFASRAERLLETCRRNQVQSSVMMVDIDHFKDVNDTHGHDVGDVVLQAVTEVLQRCTRALDVVGRMGGEEFAILMPGAELAGAAHRAEILRAGIEALRVEIGSGRTLNVTASFGVAVCAGDLDEALQQADEALYSAKESGRNRVASAGEF